LHAEAGVHAEGEPAARCTLNAPRSDTAAW